MDYGNLSINGIGFMVMVVGVVEASKKFGVSGKWLTALAMTLGVCLSVGYQLSAVYPDFKTVFDIVVFGLGGGIAATGYYDLLWGRKNN